MGDPFSAIGFTIQDEESFQRLAEQAHTLGTPSTILRQNILLQGFCWHLGEGLEIWTILKEGKSGTFYTDCRPAFRSSLYYPINSWEIIEFIEDGEAILSGQIQNFNLSFELQNFTEISESIFNYPSLRAQIAGLCTRFQIIREQPQSQLTDAESVRATRRLQLRIRHGARQRREWVAWLGSHNSRGDDGRFHHGISGTNLLVLARICR